MLSNYISTPVFITSFAVGLFFIYVLGPETKKIFIYPSPETTNKILIKDKADQCFHYKENVVECPLDESFLFTTPIQS